MDGDLLRSLQKQNTDALEQAIAQYGAYVLTIIRNRSRGVLAPEDHEEIASDVFLSLWHGARDITSGQVRPWLGAVARNKTVEVMRRKKVFVPLEDDALISLDRLWEQMYESQRCEAIRQALSCEGYEFCHDIRHVLDGFFSLHRHRSYLSSMLSCLIPASPQWSLSLSFLILIIAIPIS